MSTTIRISKSDKQKLDSIVRYLSFKSQKKLTQEEIMAKLLNLGEKYKQDLLKVITNDDDSEDLSNDPIFDLPKIQLDPKASKDVDHTIYGENKE